MQVPRLKRRPEFLRTAAKGRKWAAPGLVLQAVTAKRDSQAGSGRDAPNGDAADPGFRVGFTCSKKVGNSVARNRARRRLRALADEVLPQAAKSGRDYVLIGRAQTIDRPFDALRRDLLKALEKTGSLAGTEEPRSPGP